MVAGMIRRLVFSALLFVLTLAAFGEDRSTIFDFHRPDRKVAEILYRQAVVAIERKDADAALFVGVIGGAWKKIYPAAPDYFVGCMLYQIGGIKGLHSVDFARTAIILAGEKRPDGGAASTPDEVQKLLKSFTEQQMIVLAKLYRLMEYYATECDDSQDEKI
jgi:hypothetical protein